MIVVQNAEKLDSKRYPTLVDDIQALDEETLLILLSEARAKDLEKAPWIEAAEAVAYCYAPRDDAETFRWVMEFADRRKIRITPEAARVIIARVGVDPSELAGEIEKVAFAQEMTIDEDAARRHIAPHREHETFEWADAVIAGRPAAARLVESATDRGKMAVAAVAALYSRLEEIEAVTSGGPIAPFRKRSALEAARAWPLPRRDRARSLLLDLDIDLKTRPMDQALALMELATYRILETRS